MGAGTVGEVVGRGQPPHVVSPKTIREVFGVVVAVVEDHIENSAFVDLVDLLLTAREEPGGTQEACVMCASG
jgi:ABC-type cobalamin/Fe3+-siderophores transport system ATPase subunit